ncbi:MAG: class I SAM-dependent methyltransferase [Candidatus Binatia bacterium]
MGIARNLAVRARSVLQPGRLSYQDRCRELIRRHAPGRTLADVGCMWKVDGAYAFHALDCGATTVTGVDIGAATDAFRQRNAAGRVRFVQGDVNDPAVIDAVGPTDVVFCSGVLYHVPNPVLTLERLRCLTGTTLILGSATIPEQAVPQAAVFYPLLGAAARRRLSYVTPWRKIGLDSAFDADAGYANWFWGFTPSCLVAMAKVAGFTVVDCHRWRHATVLVCG